MTVGCQSFERPDNEERRTLSLAGQLIPASLQLLQLACVVGMCSQKPL